MDHGGRVLIAGGGIAALEGLLAIRDLTSGGADVTLLAPEREFTYRPLLVLEPFSADLADRRDLPSLVAEHSASFVEDRLVAVDDAAGVARTAGGERIEFDHALIAIGARLVPALSSAHTLWVEPVPTGIDVLLDRAAEAGGLDLIVPGGITWPLPLYEFALMARRRVQERGEETPIRVLTPEQAPLIIFGAAASAEVAGALDARGVEVTTGVWVDEEDGEIVVHGDAGPPTGYPVALPRMEAIPVEGLPADEHGFLPLAEGARVRGLERVWAAGDGTSFPVKQGGIATQQADLAAEGIAAALGHDVERSDERPVLRGKLLTGTESISMRAQLSGGAGEGAVSSDYLWWPPHKVSGRYLAPLLDSDSVQIEGEPPGRSYDIEVPLDGPEPALHGDGEAGDLMPSLSDVPIGPRSPERFREVLGDDYAPIEQAITRARDLFAGRVIWHVNSTATGGGVAELLHSLLAYTRGAGVDARWLVLGGSPEFFRITKRIHNNLHGFDSDGGRLGEDEMAEFKRISDGQAAELAEMVHPGDIVYLHDPQTAGMLPRLAESGATVFWRCHIGIDSPNDVIRAAWDWLRPMIEGADRYIFSRREYAWEGLDPDRVAIIEPSIDAFSAKNQDLEPQVVRAILGRIGLCERDGVKPTYTRQDGTPARVDRTARLDQEQLLPEAARF